MTTIFAIGNQKGGVAKTTTCWVLGCTLTERGRSVLLVDMDPQASLTIACGVTDTEDKSIAEVLGGGKPGTLDLQDIIVKLDDGLYLAPSDIALSGSELGLVTRMGRENVLRRVLSGSHTDYILIDCPPSLGLLTVNSLVAADRVLIPVQPDYLSLRGLAFFYDSLKQVQQELNPDLRVFGILPTFYDSRPKHHDEIIEAMKNQGLPVLPVRTRRSVRVAESAQVHTSILEYEKRNPNVEAYRKLAEIIDG